MHYTIYKSQNEYNNGRNPSNDIIVIATRKVEKDSRCKTILWKELLKVKYTSPKKGIQKAKMFSYKLDFKLSGNQHQPKQSTITRVSTS